MIAPAAMLAVEPRLLSKEGWEADPSLLVLPEFALHLDGRSLTARADRADYCLRPAAGVRPVEVRCTCSAPTSDLPSRGGRFFRDSAADW